MPLSASRSVHLISALLILGLSACEKAVTSDGYKHFGSVVFRRSYAGHENWTESQLDSAHRAAPEYMTNHAQGDTVLRILQAMGIVENERLLIEEDEGAPLDTIVIGARWSDPDAAYIEKDTINWKMALCIKGGRTTDRFVIESVGSSFFAELMPSRTSDQPFVAILQQYYIMNGDNFQVDAYGKTGPRYGEK